MSVYKATSEDKEALFAMALTFLGTTSYDYNHSEILYLVDKMLEEGVMFIDESKKGMIGGVFVPFIYTGEFQAIELCWWVDESIRHTGVGKELLRAFEDYAIGQGCKYITMISLDDQVGKVYEKLGYALTERTYMKELR